MEFYSDTAGLPDRLSEGVSLRRLHQKGRFVSSGLLEDADHLCPRTALLAFVQTSLAALPELGRFQPVQHEQCAFNASQFLHRKVNPIPNVETGPVQATKATARGRRASHNL